MISQLAYHLSVQDGSGVHVLSAVTSIASSNMFVSGTTLAQWLGAIRNPRSITSAPGGVAQPPWVGHKAGFSAPDTENASLEEDVTHTSGISPSGVIHWYNGETGETAQIQRLNVTLEELSGLQFGWKILYLCSIGMEGGM